MPKSVAAGLAGVALLCAMPARAAANEPVKITQPQAVKGQTRVVIGAFNVGFLFESVDGTKGAPRAGLITAFSGPTSAKSRLEGVTPAMMQAVTDAAYADFRAQLATRGFDVVEPAQLFAAPEIAKLKPLASPLDVNVVLEKNSKGKTSFYKPTALPAMLLLPTDFTGSGLSSMGTAMAAGQMGYQMGAYAKSAGQAVLDVVYLIDFSNVKRPGAFSFSGVRVSSGVSVTGDYSKLSLIAPTGKTATVQLKQPLVVEGDFAEMRDTTGGFNKGAETAFNVAGSLLGMGAGKSRTFTFAAKPAYQDGAIKAATLANARVVEALAALR